MLTGMMDLIYLQINKFMKLKNVFEKLFLSSNLTIITREIIQSLFLFRGKHKVNRNELNKNKSYL